MNARSARIAFPLALLGVMSLFAGCSGSLAVATPPGRSPQAAIASPSDAVRVVGQLSLKGSEPGAWWAITDDSGAVSRLEPASTDQAAEFRQWQNRRVEITGTRLTPTLNTPRLKVERAQLVR